MSLENISLPGRRKGGRFMVHGIFHFQDGGKADDLWFQGIYHYQDGGKADDL